MPSSISATDDDDNNNINDDGSLRESVSPINDGLGCVSSSPETPPTMFPWASLQPRSVIADGALLGFPLDMLHSHMSMALSCETDPKVGHSNLF